MKKYFRYFVLFATASCNTQSVDTSVNTVSTNIYDSIQSFVNVNRKYNIDSKIYLLELTRNSSDTINLVLTTLSESHIPTKFRLCPFILNEDSSILILYKLTNSIMNRFNIVKDISGVKYESDESIIYNPISWEISVTNDRIVIDRNFGRNQAEQNVIKPKNKFIPPK